MKIDERFKRLLHGTRSLLAQTNREKGKPKISKLLHEYAAGDEVIIKMDYLTEKSMPHKRFRLSNRPNHSEKRGRGYVISVLEAIPRKPSLSAG